MDVNSISVPFCIEDRPNNGHQPTHHLTLTNKNVTLEITLYTCTIMRELPGYPKDEKGVSVFSLPVIKSRTPV